MSLCFPFLLRSLCATLLSAAAVMSGTITPLKIAWHRATQVSLISGGCQRCFSIFDISKKGIQCYSFSPHAISVRQVFTNLLCDFVNAHPQSVVVPTYELPHGLHHLRFRNFSDTLKHSFHVISVRQVGDRLLARSLCFHTALRGWIRLPNILVFDVRRNNLHDMELV